MANNGEFYAIFSPIPQSSPRTICSHATLKSSSLRFRIFRSPRSLFNRAVCHSILLMAAGLNAATNHQASEIVRRELCILVIHFQQKKFTLFYSTCDSLVCRLLFALLVLPVRSLPPAILPSDLGTTTRESPEQRVLVGHPRCIGKDFDGIFRAAWLVPPWTSQAACESSQTFCRPLLQC